VSATVRLQDIRGFHKSGSLFMFNNAVAHKGPFKLAVGFADYVRPEREAFLYQTLHRPTSSLVRALVVSRDRRLLQLRSFTGTSETSCMKLNTLSFHTIQTVDVFKSGHGYYWTRLQRTDSFRSQCVRLAIKL